MITEKQSQDYLEKAAQLCPYCGGHDIYIKPLSYTGDELLAWCVVECEDCTRSWREIFKMIGIEPDD